MESVIPALRRDIVRSRGTGVPPVITGHHRRDACAPWKLIALAALVICMVVPARAEVLFDWGSEVYSELFDSYGNRLDASYKFELGAFDPSFTPTAGNITSWAANWKVFDSTTINTTFDLFRSSAYMLDDGTSSSAFAHPDGYDFRGLDAYIWGHNTKSYTQTLEWVWFRAPSWVFPASVTPGPPVTPTDWSISQLTAGDVPLFGRQGTAVGLGYASAPGVLGQYNLQTYTLTPGPSGIPEPSTVFFAALLVAIAAFHRWNRARAAKVVASLSLLAAFALPAEASRINFYSSPGVSAYGSDGQSLNEDTSFELGVFANGFVPSATNTAQWSANWVPAQRTKFTTAHNWFTSVFNVTNNTAPFLVGAPAYVWGFNGSEAQGQWILFRATNWAWPAANGSAPQPLLWSAKDATVVVLGSLAQANGGAVSLRSLAVANSLPPVTTWGQFKAEKLQNSAHGNPGDDADGDGISNILEFALGTAPNNAAERPASPGTWNRLARGPDGKDYLEVRVPRRRDRAVNFTAQVSSDLNTWASGTNHTRVVSDTADAMTVRDTVPIGEAGNARFMRVKAAPQ